MYFPLKQRQNGLLLCGKLACCHLIYSKFFHVSAWCTGLGKKTTHFLIARHCCFKHTVNILMMSRVIIRCFAKSIAHKKWLLIRQR